VITVTDVKRVDASLPIVSVRLDRAVWSAPGAPPAPRSMEGRFGHDPGEGQRYLAVLTLYPYEPDQWWPLNCAALPLDGEGRTEGVYYTGPRGLAGKTPEQVAEILRD
jgi:hypothetical protein